MPVLLGAASLDRIDAREPKRLSRGIAPNVLDEVHFAVDGV